MACLLWNDGQQSGCVDIEASEGVVIGRYSFHGQQWFPRNLIEFINLRGFWQVRLVSSYDWIDVQYFDGSSPLAERKWRSIGEVPVLIDDNTMIRVVIDTYMMKLIFIDDLNCQSASLIGHMWVSRLWDIPVVQTEAASKTVPMQVPDADQRIMGWLDWLAKYLETHRWAAIGAILIVAASAIGVWYFTGHQSEPIRLEPTQGR